MNSKLTDISTEVTPKHIKMIGLLIGLTFLVLIIWMNLAKVDVGVTATGKIELVGENQYVVPIQKMKLKQIFVEDGQTVKKGDLLAVFDLTIEKERFFQLSSEREYLRGQLEAYRSLVLGIEDVVLNDMLNVLVSHHKSVLALKKAEREALQEEIVNIERLIKAKQNKYDILELSLLLEAEQDFKREQQRTLRIQQELLILEEEIINVRAKQSSIIVELDKTAIDLQKFHSETEISWQNKVEEYKTRLFEIDSEIYSLQVLLEHEIAIAGDDGVIVKVHSVIPNTWVEPNEPLIVMERLGKNMRIRADIPVDYLIWAQIAEETRIILNEFPQNVYGHMEGEYVSYNTEIKEIEGQGSFYSVYLDVQNDKLFNLPDKFEFFDGQGVSVVFSRDERTIMKYAINPLLKGFHKTIVDPHK